MGQRDVGGPLARDQRCAQGLVLSPVSRRSAGCRDVSVAVTLGGSSAPENSDGAQRQVAGACRPSTPWDLVFRVGILARWPTGSLVKPSGCLL